MYVIIIMFFISKIIIFTGDLSKKYVGLLHKLGILSLSKSFSKRPTNIQRPTTERRVYELRYEAMCFYPPSSEVDSCKRDAILWPLHWVTQSVH